MSTPITFADFSGGMNLILDSTAIGDNQYSLSYNIRNRNSNLAPVRGVVEDTSAPAGKKQGLYAFDKYLVLFVAGKAYYKNIINDSAWTLIAGLAMNPKVFYIYTQVVPASTFNYGRNLVDPDKITGNANYIPVVSPSIAVNGSPGGLVVQDGINQPWIILPDGTARVTQRYSDWSTDFREYVPIMKQMAYINGILFGVEGHDGKVLYRSVSGRPLDFVVNVTSTGDKGGDASTTAYAVGFSEITCLQTLATGELLVGTNQQCHPIEFDYTNTIFAEPKFLNRKSFASGVVNQFSFVNVLRWDGNGTDYYFIDLDGLRTFNGVTALQNEGRNTSFSLMLNSFLEAKQVISAAVVFDDYSLFSVKTLESKTGLVENVIAVYDNLKLQWVCFDNYNIGTIKQFAVADQSANPVLYAITDDKVYKLFSTAADFVESDVRLKSNTSQTSSVQIRNNDIRVVFGDGLSLTGIATVTEYINGFEGSNVREHLKGLLTENLRFNFSKLGKQAWSVQPRIQWNNGSSISLVEVDITPQTQETNIQQQAKRYGS